VLLADGAPTSLQDLNTAYSTNPLIKSVVDSFGTSAESQALYGSGNSSVFINAVYQNVLGRSTATDPNGAAYWTGLISSGTMTQAQAALAIAAAASAEANTSSDEQIVSNRLAVANYFTAQVAVEAASQYTGNTVNADAREILGAVTATTNPTTYQATVNSDVTAIATNACSGPAGNTISLSGTRSNYSITVLNCVASITGPNVSMSVPVGTTINFSNGTYTVKNSYGILHGLSTQAQEYSPLTASATAALPVGCLQMGAVWGAGASNYSVPNMPSTIVVGYVNSTQITGNGGWDQNWNPAWNTSGGYTIQPGAPNVPDYLAGGNVPYDPFWQGYTVMYWLPTWPSAVEAEIDVVASENFDGVMLDVSTAYENWLGYTNAYSQAWLQQQYMQFLTTISNYAHTKYGNTFVIFLNIDPFAYSWMTNLGQVIDAGSYQNILLNWNGNGSISLGQNVDQEMTFLHNQNLPLLTLDQLGTSHTEPANFVSANLQTYIYVAEMAMAYGFLPYVSNLYLDTPPWQTAPRYIQLNAGQTWNSSDAYNDWFLGSKTGNSITSSGAGNDYFFIGGGSNSFTGGAGFNTVVYPGPYSSYTISKQSNGSVIVATAGSSTSDTFSNVQALQFAGGAIYNLATSTLSGGATQMVANGNFANGLNNWNFYVTTSDSAKASVAASTNAPSTGGKSVQISVTEPGAKAWDIALDQSPLTLVAGTTYRLDFSASADVPLVLNVDSSGGMPSPTWYGLSQQIVIGKGWKTYTVYFTANSSTTDAALHFWVGSGPGNLWLTNVSLMAQPGL